MKLGPYLCIALPALSSSLFATGCTRKLALSVELAVPERPDPFDGVARVRMRALVAGRIELVGEGRWDQGPLDLPTAIDPEVERLIVEGVGEDGRVISSGASVPLDLLRAAPDGALRILFSRAGELSTLAYRLGPRKGGAAIQLANERVLFVGGEDDRACAIETTELAALSHEEPRLGPPLAEGRLGELHALSLPDGRALILGGETAPGCGDRATATRLAILDPDASTGRLAELSPQLDAARQGAAAVVVSDTLAIVAGGADSATVSDTASRFNPRALELAAPGKLGEPRAESAAAVVAGGRVLFAGGRSGLDEAAILDDAEVFDPVRGAASPMRIALGPPIAGAASLVTAAGSVILAGGRGAGGAASDRVRAVVVQPERAQAFGDTSTVASLGVASSSGSLIDLFDGSVLYLPRAPSAALERVALFPRGVSAVELPGGVSGPLIGGRTIDGVVLLRAEDGSMHVFNPGLAGVLGAYGVADVLAGIGGAGVLGELGPIGVIPERPVSWTLEDGRLAGRLLPELPRGGTFPGELAVLGGSKLADFDARFTLELGVLSQASFIFALEGGELDHVVFLGGLTLVARSRVRQAESPISCDSLPTPELAQPGVHAIRVRRTGAEVRVSIGAKELVCTTPNPVAGRLAFGVIAGDAKLGALSIDL